MHLVEAGSDEFEQRRHGGFRVLALGLDLNRRAAFRGQRHHAEDALAVDAGFVLAHLDRALEAVGDLDELRPRPDVHPEGVHDTRLTLDHGHIHPTMSATAANPSARRRPFRRSPRQRNARNARAATIASVTRATGGKSPVKNWTESGSAAPPPNPIPGSSNGPARRRNRSLGAVPTPRPSSHPPPR